MVFESPIRKKLEKIKENANNLNEYMKDLLKEIEEEKGHPLRAKIKDEKAILKLEREEYDTVVEIQNNAIEASKLFRKCWDDEEAPPQLKNKNSALYRVSELIKSINQEVLKINSTSEFHEIASSANNIRVWTDEALDNIEEVDHYVHEHLPAYSDWVFKHFRR